MVEHPDSFVGRTAELAALREVLGDVRSGQPQTVLITGPAGIGKTSLVDQFLLEVDATVLRASGEQWEALVAFGVIDQLLRAAGLSKGLLLAGRNRSLPPEEPVGVGTVLLEALEGLERNAPVVLLVDDAQWADVDSLRALLFALRRLVTGRVLTLLAEREEDANRLPDGLRRLASGTTGRSLRVDALDSRDVQELATALGVPRLSLRTAERLRDHTGGSPLFVRALLSEVPVDRWRTWQQPVLPAPRAFVAQVVTRLSACSPSSMALVEACSVLGVRSSLHTAAAVAQVDDPVGAFEEAVVVGLLQGTDAVEIWDVMFPHPLVQAAVYEHVAPTVRVRLHRAAAGLAEDAGAALRHRVAATTPPNAELAAALDVFARGEMRWGAWASAASALVEAGRMSVRRDEREERLLRAMDAIVSAGDLPQAFAFARDVARFESGPLRDAALGYLAVLRGRVTEAESLLTMGWKRSDPASDPHLAALLALRWTLHSVGRLRGAEIVEWSRRSMALVPEDDAVRLEAEAILGLGLGLMGRVPDGIAAYEDVLAPLTGDEGSTAGRVWMAKSWLQLVVDDLDGIPQTLADVARDQLGGGSVRIAVWAHVWRSRALFLLGDWDDAAASAERAVSLLEETGHNLLRPLARWVAVSVPTGRGEWAAAEAHAERAVADRGDYELMIVAAALAAAEPAWARGDHEGVLGALAPVRAIQPRQGVDEPGFWPWQHLYADALVSVGRLGDAAEFLAPHEELATERKRRSSIARLARVRGRLEAAAGRMDAAEAAFRHGLDQFDPDKFNRVPLPFERALLELAYGQMLRRRGRRREATTQLDDARERFDALGARPYVERCDLELGGLGRIRARGSTWEPGRLTRQELAVARRVVAGMSNRDIASDMAISVKTVQFHIGNVYSKLGVHTRVQLANRLRTRLETMTRSPDEI